MKWTKDNINFLISNSYKYYLSDLSLILNRSKRSIQIKMQRLNLKYLKLKDGSKTNKKGNCLVCNKEIKGYNKKFCSRSCSVSYTNKIKGPKTEEFKTKVSLKLKKERPKCKICKNYCNKINNIYCSRKCMGLDTDLLNKLSLIAKNRYIVNPELHPNRKCAGIKESYPEKIFKDYLIKNNIKFEQQYKIENFYVDFFLSDLQLLIEIDGERWHDPNSEKEINRENILKNYYSLLRFKAKDIVKGKFSLQY